MVSSLTNDMKLIAGLPIYVGDIPVKPMTLGEIAEIGYETFQQGIYLLSLTIDDMIEAIEDFEIHALLKAERHQYKTFDLYMISNGLSDLVIDGFKMLFRTEEIELLGEFDDVEVIINKEYVVNRENFDEIVDVIQMQNNPTVSKNEDEADYNPADDVAHSIAQKLKKGKEITKKSKALESDGEGIAIVDVISAVTAMSNSINKINVWGYTPYQLYDEFARLNKIDNYNLQIQASMWSSEVEIEHWSEPL